MSMTVKLHYNEEVHSAMHALNLQFWCTCIVLKVFLMIISATSAKMCPKISYNIRLSHYNNLLISKLIPVHSICSKEVLNKVSLQICINFVLDNTLLAHTYV